MITLDKIKERLLMLGYPATAADDAMLTYIWNTVQRSVLLSLNILEVPESIENIVIDKICGEFLANKRATGPITGFDVGTAIKSIAEGDTTVTYDANTSPEAQFDMLLKWLISGRDSVLLRCRRIRW